MLSLKRPVAIKIFAATWMALPFLSSSLMARPCSQEPSEESAALFVLTSLSVPVSLWQQTSPALEKLKGVFILRGMPNDSFLELTKALIDLRNLGVNAPIVIDPEKFDALKQTTVPAIVLETPKKRDVITGNVSLSFALEEFAHKGSNKKLAKRLLTALYSSTQENPSPVLEDSLSTESPFRSREEKRP